MVGRAAGLCLFLLFISAVEGTRIGIDLGTTHSCAAFYDGRDETVEIIADEQGNTITPSWVAFTHDDADADEPLIGEAARDQAALNPDSAVFDVRRFIGRQFDDPEVQRDMKLLPFKVVNKDGKPYINVKVKNNGDHEMKLMSPEEITAAVMKKLKQRAESHLGKEVKNAVVAFPAHFTDAQRQATKDAGAIAGLNVVEMINEPTAAAMAYGLDRKKEINILVFDLGGGTLDVTILTSENGDLEVLSTNGDSHLGGEHFDQNLMDYFVKLIKKKYNKDTSEDKNALWKLRKECERAKKALSIRHQVHVEIESFLDGINLNETLSRTRFEELNMNLFKKTLIPVKQALKDLGLEKKDIDEIVLVGGSTRIPKVQQLLKDFFDGKEPNKWINPDEAIAHGAAIQGALYKGSNEEFFIGPDVHPLRYGVETLGGVMTRILGPTLIPIRKTQVFTTCEDSQTTVSIQVFEGKGNLTKDCHELGKIYLSGIPPAPRGVPQIEVTFEIGEIGPVQVTVMDKSAKESNMATASFEHREREKRDEKKVQELVELALEKTDNSEIWDEIFDLSWEWRVIEKNDDEKLVQKMIDSVEDLNNSICVMSSSS